jgi:hypothetical protein
MNNIKNDSWVVGRILLLLFLPLIARAGGDEVAVVYNSAFPGS